MSGFGEDCVAEGSMLKEAWERLHKVDSGNEWLRYFDPVEAALIDIDGLIAAVWNTESFNRTKGRMIYLMAKYTAKLKAEARQLV